LPAPTEPIVLYGMPASLYTGKARAYLRRRGLPFEERSAGDPRFRAQVLPVVGRWIIPVVQLPGGRLVQDSTDIIDALDAGAPPGESAYPASPLLRAVSLFFELYGGEGLLRPAMHYRWNFDADNLAFLRADFGASLAAPGASRAERDAAFEFAAARMRKAATAFGVTPLTAPLIEAACREFLARFDAHLEHHPFLLGGRATIGDYGLVAALYAHLGRDPHPASLMKSVAPHVWRWVERMNAPERSTGEYAHAGPADGRLFDDDALPGTLVELLRFAAQDYLPEIEAHVAFANRWLREHPDLRTGTNGLAKPGERAIGRATFAWRGGELTVVVMPYRLYLLQRVQDAIASAPAADRGRLDALLADAGLASLASLTTIRRVERRDHLEVWGPPR